MTVGVNAPPRAGVAHRRRAGVVVTTPLAKMTGMNGTMTGPSVTWTAVTVIMIAVIVTLIAATGTESALASVREVLTTETEISRMTEIAGTTTGRGVMTSEKMAPMVRTGRVGLDSDHLLLSCSLCQCPWSQWAPPTMSLTLQSRSFIVTGLGKYP